MPSFRVFEQPLNERVRLFLRLETLSSRLSFFAKQSNEACSYSALLTILEITALVERNDIKQEVMKEIERQQAILKTLTSHQSVNKATLEGILSKLYQASHKVHDIKGKMGGHIKAIDFLLALKQRTAIPGGSCDFDLAELHYWLGQQSKQRQDDISRWSQPYTQLNSIIDLLLKVIRDSGHSTTVTAQSGFYQENLDSQQANQLLRISIPKTEVFYPEISAGKQRFSVRLLAKTDADKPPRQLKHDVGIKLIRCVL